MRSLVLALSVLALAFALGTPGRALTFDNTFDSTVTTNGDSAEFISAIDYAEAQLSSDFSNPITVNLTIELTPGTSTLGESETQLYGDLTYAEVRSTLAADATTANDATAVASLGATDPTHGGDFLVSGAEGKALGLIGASAASDGTVIFGAGYTYTFDPSNRAVAGDYDFIGIAEHEITEVMGRIAAVGQDLGNGVADYVPYDLFRYSAPGTRSLSSTATDAYFSINSGTTDLKNFNPAGNGGDLADWQSITADSFNAFTSSGVENPLTSADLTALDVIGYDAVPEPGTWALLMAAGLLCAVASRARGVRS